MSAMLVMLATLLATIAVTAGALALVGRWLRYQRAGFARALLTASIWMALGVLAFAIDRFLNDRVSVPFSPAYYVLGFCGLVACEIFTVRFVQKTSDARALAGWALMFVVRIGISLGIFLGVRGRLTEAFTAPTMSMAPTILPRHAITVCPRCGGRLYAELDEELLARFRNVRGNITTAICMTCRQQSDVSLKGLTPEPPDRFFDTKFLTPERWDVVTFHHDGTVYVKRLVALPGEEISIDGEGHLSINGHPASAPSDVPGGVFRWPAAGLASLALNPERKLLLGPDEYFVLGDNAERSADSRIFGPVKGKDFMGVVTWIYWPVSRMRILR